VRHRAPLAALVALLALLGVAGAGTAAAPEKHYLRLTAEASFELQLDYGSNKDAVYNGTYFKGVYYHVRAIVVYDGSTVALLPGQAMVVQSMVIVNDDRTQWVSAVKRKPVACKSAGRIRPGSWQSHSGTGEAAQFEFTKGGRVVVSSDGFTVDPGASVENVGCTATEELENHGLPGGPFVVVSAPPRSSFVGDKVFSINCSDEYSHPFKKETGGNGHSFSGSASASMTLTPFPASTLTDVKKALRDSVGTEAKSGTPGKPKDCLH
jgi:hypothetical protein